MGTTISLMVALINKNRVDMPMVLCLNRRTKVDMVEVNVADLAVDSTVVVDIPEGGDLIAFGQAK